VREVFGDCFRNVIGAVRYMAAPTAAQGGNPKSQPGPDEASPLTRVLVAPRWGFTADKGGKFEARNGGPDREGGEPTRPGPRGVTMHPQFPVLIREYARGPLL
jgi:hypothetical protein